MRSAAVSALCSHSLPAGTVVGVPISCSLSWSEAERESRLLTVSDISLTDHPGLVDKAGTRSEIRHYFAILPTARAMEVCCLYTIGIKIDQYHVLFLQESHRAK